MTNLTSDQKSWIEVENTFLTNTPRGTNKPPTEVWLFTWDCKRLKRGIRRKRSLVALKVNGSADLEKKLTAFMGRPGVTLIEDSRS